MERLDLSEATACLCLAARREARALTRLYEQHLRAHGLRATQFSVLAGLALKGPTPMGELAEFLGLERTTLTRSTSIMSRRGWVGEVPSADARERVLAVTPSGRRKVEEALPAWQRAQSLAADRTDAQKGALRT